jgi:hypothetical protein
MDSVARDARKRLTFAELLNVSMVLVLTSSTDTSVFANQDGLVTCAMSMWTTVIPILVPMMVNVSMMSMTTAVSVSKDLQENDASIPLIIAALILVKMVEPARIRKPILFANAGQDTLA